MILFLVAVSQMVGDFASTAIADDSHRESHMVLRFSDRDDLKRGLFIEGLSATQLVALRKLESNEQELSKCVSVHVVPEKQSSSGETKKLPPVMGKVSIVANPPLIYFEPRFAFRDGVRYRVKVQFDGCEFESELLRPKVPESPSTVVEKVFPSGSQLPENLLKFYVHFSSPMAIRDSYKHIHLMDEDGRELEFPFLEIREELWDPTGKRLTLLLDPGRIKRGLVPNLEDGAVLHQGKRYSLRIDAAIQDARGQRLLQTFEKRFATTESDYKQPRIEDWSIQIPKAGDRNPLVIRFGESLDQALADRGIQVLFEANVLAGELSLMENESVAHFVPASDWKAGEYALSVNAQVEDLAGNSFRKPFEIEIDGGERRLSDGFVKRRFVVE
jgi:hypothetical protein